MKTTMISSILSGLANIAKNKHGLWIMGVICFFEPVCIPIFPELAIIPLALARPQEKHKIFGLALLLTTLGSLVGYILGYFLASAIFKILGIPDETFHTFRSYIVQYGFFLPLMGSLLPAPLKLITLTCGMTKFNLSLMLISVFIGRAIRFGAGIYLFSRTILSWSSKIAEKKHRLSKEKADPKKSSLPEVSKK